MARKVAQMNKDEEEKLEAELNNWDKEMLIDLIKFIVGNEEQNIETILQAYFEEGDSDNANEEAEEEDYKKSQE